MSARKANLAMFNNSDDDEPSIQRSKVDENKLHQYTQGTVRKSKKDKEREAAEAKQREEEAKAAEAYAEFLNDFQGQGTEKGGRGTSFVKAGESSGAAPQDRGRGDSRPGVRMGFDDLKEVTPPLTKPPTRGKRAMDAFLEEIKRDQAAREERLQRSSMAKGSSVTALAAFESQRGSRDIGDPLTTNIFVANLPNTVTETSLGMYFARCGPVGSVKIMWPRFEESTGPPGGPPTGPRRPQGLSGFVSFMKRKDAEAAVRDLDGLEWEGSALRVGWSKAVPVAAKPMYDLGVSSTDNTSSNARRARSRSYSPERRPKHRGRSRSRSPSPPRNRYRSPERERFKASYERERSPPPKGRNFGQSRSREDDRRWRSRSRTRSPEERHRARTPEAPPFDDDGANSIYSTDSAEASEKENGQKGKLGKLALQRFESMLRGMTGRRGEVARLMSFALDHADAAPQVASVILQSLMVDSTPVPRKVARLHLVCDILHNSAASVPNAWKYRQEFESRLGEVFDHLAVIRKSFPGRITADVFNLQIEAVIQVWEDWIVFPPEKTGEYRRRLEGDEGGPAEEEVEEEEEEEEKEEAPQVSKFKASAFRPAEEVEAEAEKVVEEEDVDGVPVDDVDGVPVDDVDGAPMEDLDGAPLEDDVDGAPLEDLDGAPLDDVDGAPLDDLDGAPLDDLDGAPLDDLDGAPLEEDIDAGPREDDVATRAMAAFSEAVMDGEDDDDEPMAIDDD